MLSDSLGLALIVGGAAFVCSGLIFLLPVRPRGVSSMKIDDEERALSRGRRSRDELS